MPINMNVPSTDSRAESVTPSASKTADPARRRLWGAEPQPYGWLLGLFASVWFLVRVFDPDMGVDDEVMRFAHSMGEALVTMICATIFALAWNTRLPEYSGRIDVAGLMFLAAGLIDFMHLMSYQPFSFLTNPALQQQALNFDLIARILMLVTLAWISAQPVFPALSPRTRRWGFVSVLLAFLVLFHITVFGRAWAEPLALQPPVVSLTRRLAEIGMIGLALLTCWQLARNFKGLTKPIRWQLFSASALLGLSSLQFVSAGDDNSLHSLIAQAAKVMACYFVYRAIVEGSIEYPRQRIVALNADLADSEQRWRLAIDAGSHAVFEWNVDEDSIRLSGSRLHSLGLPPDALLSRGSQSLLDRVNAEDRADLAQLLQHARAERLERLQHSFRLHPDQGPEHWMELRAGAVQSSNGTHHVMIGSLTDISEHKRALVLLAQSEAKLNGIIDSAMDAIVTVDQNMKIVLFNKSAEHIFRCSAEDVLGGTLDRFLPPRHRGNHDTHIRRFGVTGVSQRRMGFSILPAVRADGTEFPISAAISQVQVEGRPLYTVIVRDVSEQVASERALVQSQRELSELSLRAHHALEDERRRVARELHDDFGQSLTAMRMELGMARQSLPAGNKTMLEHCDRMEAMIAAMVAATRRISSDLRPLVLDDLGLGAAIDWLVERFSEQHRIAADVYVDEDVAHLEEPYASALFRIVQESLTNVARHSGASAVEVRIESLDNQIRATIWDNGRGMATGSIEQRKTFGLRGLRERAQLLGGTFEIFSRLGEGTTIRVSLPSPESAQSKGSQ